LSGRLEAVTLDEPLFVVQLGPLQQRDSRIFNGLKSLHPQQLLFEGMNRPLDATVAFRGAYERRTRLDSGKTNLVLEGGADVLRTMIVAQLQTVSHLRPDFPEAAAHRLAHRS